MSVPDQIFGRASRAASELGISRSEFFSDAARRYLDELDAHTLIDQIDSAHVHGIGEAESAAVVAGHRVLDAADDEW